MSSFLNDLHRGEFDPDLVKTFETMPLDEDTMNNTLLTKMFRPLGRLEDRLVQAQVDSVVVPSESPAEPEGATTPSIDGLPLSTNTPPGTPAKDPMGSSPVGAVGDVTSSFEEQAVTSQQKIELCARLNHDARTEREAAMEAQVHQLAANVWRSRVVVVDSAEAAKRYMQQSSPGITARTIVIDFAMPADLQSGPRSRKVSRNLTKEIQKALAEKAQLIPATSIYGSILVRGCGHCAEEFHDILDKSHSFKRTVTVPVDVPEDWMRFVRSAQRRSNGPVDESVTGIDFVARTIGRRTRARAMDEDTDDDEDWPAQGQIVVPIISTPLLTAQNR